VDRRLTLLAPVLALLAGACRTVGVVGASNGSYSEVSPAVANEMLLDSQQVVVIDVRSADAYRGPEGHIAGALNAPFDSIEKKLPELLPYQSQTILVYGQTSTDGALGAKLLVAAGFRNVVHVAGGFTEWSERGYRVVNSQ
jgi:rhodanese-related sulfurtransferase